MASSWNDIEDVSWDIKLKILQFFTYYKVPDGATPSTFAYDAKFLDKRFAHEVINNKHQEWKHLVNGSVNRTIDGITYEPFCGLCPENDTKPEYRISHHQLVEWSQNLWTEYLGSSSSCL
eukprot:TRINITY_DN12271_c0_g1_i1.p1 TRINITY_DN12271_c0_g1~~TRINITY_DN12271_c0_g1_i1.p1  ORF type:complete len:120 (-),score=22.21 TRINITY_DN12271_c0_g1_i1:95-454(-)